MNGWKKREGSQGGKQVGRESEENDGGRWEEGTQELIKRGRMEAMEVDQVQEVMVGTCVWDL